MQINVCGLCALESSGADADEGKCLPTIIPIVFSGSLIARLRNPGYKFGEICVHKLIASHLRRPMLRNYHAKFTQLKTKIPKRSEHYPQSWERV